MPDEPHYRLTICAAGDGPPLDVRLRRFLKSALRAHRLRCVSIERFPPSAEAAGQGSDQAHGEPCRTES